MECFSPVCLYFHQHLFSLHLVEHLAFTWSSSYCANKIGIYSFFLRPSANSSNPADLLKFGQISQFLVPTFAQSHNSFANALHSMQAVLQIHQNSALTNVQVLFYLNSVLPSVQAVYWLPTIRVPTHIQCCCTLQRVHLRDLPIRALVNPFCDVFAVLIHAYAFDKCQCLRTDTVLLSVLLMAFLICSYVFAPLMLKTMWGIIYRPLSLQSLSRRCVVQIRHLFNPRAMMTVPVPSVTSLLPKYASSSNAYIGGGSSRLAWATIQPYVISQPGGALQDLSFLCYVAYVEKMNVNAYPIDLFVHANIPPLVVSQLLKLSVARSIAASHGIAAGSRCSVEQLKLLLEHHECISCPSYLTIFSVVSDPATKRASRNKKYYTKILKPASAGTISEQLFDPIHSEFPATHLQFPPAPCSIELEHTIIRDACKRMDPQNFEEVGCAVCGELCHRAKTSRLKAVKNLLSILEAPGITRAERKDNAASIKEFKGPVLDYSCSAICDSCRSDVR